MGFIEFIFVILIIVPVAVVMLVIFRKLTGEYNAFIREERGITKRSRNKEDQSSSRSELKSYRRDNPQYDAYRRKMESSSFNRKRDK